MDIQEQIAVIVHTISHQGGRIDALNATLLSMLHLAKSSPGLREAIEAQLEQNYSSLLAFREPAVRGRVRERARPDRGRARDGAAPDPRPLSLARPGRSHAA